MGDPAVFSLSREILLSTSVRRLLILCNRDVIVAKHVKFLMAAIPRHTLLNLGKCRVRARDGRATACGPRAETLRFVGTLALLGNATTSGQFLAGLACKAPPAPEAVIAPMLRLRSMQFVDIRPFRRPQGSDTIPIARRPPRSKAGQGGSVQPALPGALSSPVVGPFCMGAAG